MNKGQSLWGQPVNWFHCRSNMLEFCDPRGWRRNKWQHCACGNQGRVCRPRRLWSFGLHLAEKTGQIFVVMVCDVHSLVMKNLGGCMGVGRLRISGWECCSGLGKGICHVFPPWGMGNICGLGILVSYSRRLCLALALV